MDGDDLRNKLETARAYHKRELDRIDSLLRGLDEAEKFAEKYFQSDQGQVPLVLTPHVDETKRSDAERIREAVSRMPETFRSSDLWEVANADGGPPIDKRRSFAPYFTRLKKRKIVIEIQSPSGNIPGQYKKGG
jgi:hypothetical protein